MDKFWKDVGKLPNIISLIRLFFGAPITIIIYHNGYQYAWLVFLFFVALDWLDGFLARRQKSVTSTGMFLDPLADQFLVLSVIWYYFSVVIGNINLPLLLTIRELLMVALRLFIKRDLPANIWGKLKVIMEYFGITLLLAGYFIDGALTLALALLLSYISFFIYASKATVMYCEDHSA